MHVDYKLVRGLTRPPPSHHAQREWAVPFSNGWKRSVNAQFMAQVVQRGKARVGSLEGVLQEVARVADGLLPSVTNSALAVFTHRMSCPRRRGGRSRRSCRV